jgi:hypothetical protein
MAPELTEVEAVTPVPPPPPPEQDKAVSTQKPAPRVANKVVRFMF